MTVRDTEVAFMLFVAGVFALRAVVAVLQRYGLRRPAEPRPVRTWLWRLLAWWAIGGALGPGLGTVVFVIGVMTMPTIRQVKRRLELGIPV
jgi:hypothetical protein